MGVKGFFKKHQQCIQAWNNCYIDAIKMSSNFRQLTNMIFATVIIQKNVDQLYPTQWSMILTKYYFKET